MKKIAIFIAAVILLSSCAGLRPNVTAGVYIDNQKGSKPTINSGNSNSQIIPINDALTINQPAGNESAEQDANATAVERKANAGGVFVNANVGDRSAATDITSAVELLDNVRGTSAGQTQTTSKGDASPATGEQTQTPTQTETKTTNIPISVSQGGASSTTAE